jgi:hypothetical protein
MAKSELGLPPPPPPPPPRPALLLEAWSRARRERTSLVSARVGSSSYATTGRDAGTGRGMGRGLGAGTAAVGPVAGGVAVVPEERPACGMREAHGECGEFHGGDYPRERLQADSPSPHPPHPPPPHPNPPTKERRLELQDP